jgi:hypothetical protein
LWIIEERGGSIQLENGGERFRKRMRHVGLAGSRPDGSFSR